MTKWGSPLIRMDGISKVFYMEDVEIHALSGIQLEIHGGEFVIIEGPSGSGKSTLLSLIGLLDVPTEGELFIKDTAVSALSKSERARFRNQEVGFIFQNFNLIGDLTSYENVELPLTYGNASRSERSRRVLEALERVDMKHRTKHYPAQLSGGEQQRVAVARALATDPLILLADEPTGNLDSHNGQAVMALLKRLHDGGSTVCMVTHDPRYSFYSARTVQLFDGRMVVGEASEVLEPKVP